VSHLGEHWTILTGLPKLAEFGGAAYGDHGWVVVGDCGGNSCGTGGGAQAFWSTDGLSWSRAPVKTGKNAIMGHAVWAAGSYWASGMAYTDPSVTDPGVAHFWRSDDGRSWDQIGTINLGPCRKSSCPYIGPMAVNAAGTLVLGWVQGGKGVASGTYVSPDGKTWTRIPDATLGLVEDSVFDLIAFGAGYLLVVAPYEGPGVVWASADGTTWTRSGELPVNIDGVRLATDGRRVVAELDSCVPDACHSEAWIQADDGTWSRQASWQGDTLTAVVYSGDAFFLTGWVDSRPRVRTSVDGLTWKEVDSDLTFDTCEAHWAAGGNGGIVMGDDTCYRLWFSTSAR